MMGGRGRWSTLYGAKPQRAPFSTQVPCLLGIGVALLDAKHLRSSAYVLEFLGGLRTAARSTSRSRSDLRLHAGRAPGAEER